MLLIGSEQYGQNLVSTFPFTPSLSSTNPQEGQLYLVREEAPVFAGGSVTDSKKKKL